MAYYYNLLNKAQQNTYHAIKTGLESLAPSFQIPRLEHKELADVFMMMRLDHPEIFYVVNFRYRFYPDSGNAEMIPEYLFEKKKVQEHQKAMKVRVEKLARPAAKLKEQEKLQYIHDFICQNVHYDKLKKPYSHEIIGPLGQGGGVCEGIAKSVKILCDALGIWCMIALSENNPEKGIKYRHAWNIVHINGKSPACEDGEHFYYKEKKLSFTKMEDVRKRAMQAVLKVEFEKELPIEQIQMEEANEGETL